MKIGNLPYLVIIILIIIILIKSGDKTIVNGPEVIKRDTITKYITVRDTIPGKIIYIKSKVDTSIWIKKADFKPDTTYSGLIKQYKSLGNSYFAVNTFSTKYKIGDYGFIIVNDTITENKLDSSSININLVIPEKTITVTETAPPKRQVYIGMILMGQQGSFLNSAHISGLLKDKKDRLYGASIGFNGQPVYGFSTYLKIKVK